MSEYLDAYKEGWRTGDVELIMGALADDFVYDDPVDGRFSRADFRVYLEGLFASEEASSGAGDTFESHAEEVGLEKDGEETAWVWFKTASAEGAALKKAGPDGVRLERLAYYTRP